MDSISYRLNVSHGRKQNLNTYRRIVREFLYVFRLVVCVCVCQFVCKSATLSDVVWQSTIYQIYRQYQLTIALRLRFLQVKSKLNLAKIKMHDFVKGLNQEVNNTNSNMKKYDLVLLNIRYMKNKA